jgi:hypothetical protein
MKYCKKSLAGDKWKSDGKTVRLVTNTGTRDRVKEIH